MFELFPEVIMFDVTHKTNNEKRPLGVCAAIDQNMEVFTPLRVFMPSECQWVFSWIIGVAMPFLLGKEPLKRNQIFLCDGDPLIYRSYDQHRKNVMPNSVHVLCAYHLVTKGLEKIQPKLTGWDQEKVRSLIATFKAWLFTWMDPGGVESEEQFSVSYAALGVWLKQHYQSKDRDIKSNAQVLEEFLTKTIMYHKHRWFSPNRRHLMTLGHKTTSPLEGGVNGALKKKCSKG
jgi:hypothetical protein